MFQVGHGASVNEPINYQLYKGYHVELEKDAKIIEMTLR